jgi:hypothetical protein
MANVRKKNTVRSVFLLKRTRPIVLNRSLVEEGSGVVLLSMAIYPLHG